MSDNEGEFLPARRVLRRYMITDMTLWRWLNGENHSFPRPYYFGRHRYFRISELDAWERDRQMKSAAKAA